MYMMGTGLENAGSRNGAGAYVIASPAWQASRSMEPSRAGAKPDDQHDRVQVTDEARGCDRFGQHIAGLLMATVRG